MVFVQITRITGVARGFCCVSSLRKISQVAWVSRREKNYSYIWIYSKEWLHSSIKSRIRTSQITWMSLLPTYAACKNVPPNIFMLIFPTELIRVSLSPYLRKNSIVCSKEHSKMWQIRTQKFYDAWKIVFSVLLLNNRNSLSTVSNLIDSNYYYSSFYISMTYQAGLKYK